VCMYRREASLRQLEMELKQERSLTETMVADMVCVCVFIACLVASLLP